MKASEVIVIARKEEGYLEKASSAQLEDKTANAGNANYTKYGAWYGLNPAQWCAMFVSWCLAQAGWISLKYCYCYNGITWFKQNATFHEKDNYTPQPGDVIFFSSSSYPKGGAHTGIVEYCDNTYVFTIEGNTSGGSTVISNGGGVVRKAYYLEYDRIYGYGTPDYESEEEDMTGEEIYEKLNEYLAEKECPEWAAEEYQKAIKAGISDGKRPMQLIPRYQATIMAYRAMK